MMKVKRERIEELYGLYEERNEYLTKGMEIMSAEGVDSPKADVAYKNADETEKKIEDKLSQIDRETDIVTGLFIEKLVAAIFPKSLSRCMKCLEVCGVEVEG